jgi:hypothetical protein
VALYRFQLIAPLLLPQLSQKQRGERLREILARPPTPPWGGEPPSLSARTLRHWLQIYQRAQGDRLAALEPKARRDRGLSKTVPHELLAQVINVREKASRLSVKEILKAIDHPARATVSRRSVARALLEAGYDKRDKRRRIAERRQGRLAPVGWDLALWEADFPNEIWQVDSTPSIWLPKGRHRDRAVRLHLVNLIDDHSRLVVGGGFVERLRVVDLLSFLCPAIATYGCPNVLFVDRAQIHRSAIVTQGMARLGGDAVFGTAGHGPGHGKVERLHQKLEDTLVELFRLNPVHTVEEATRRHELWREQDALGEHTTTGEPPLTRWRQIEGNARIPSEEELRWAFRGEVDRTVGKLGEIKWDGKLYEAPPSHRRSSSYRATIRFDLLDDSQVWIEDEDGSRHPCPRYRVRSHTERRRCRPGPAAGLSFRALFDGTDQDDGGLDPDALST